HPLLTGVQTCALPIYSTLTSARPLSDSANIGLSFSATAGVGNDVVAEKLRPMFAESLSGRAEVRVELVSDHQTARDCTAGFMRESGRASCRERVREVE